MKLLALLKGYWRAAKQWWTPVRKVRIAATDELPAHLPRKDLILVHDDGEDWSVGFWCPCGCGESIELALLQDVKPRWDLIISLEGLPTLHPSVWRRTGCRSHFWLRDGIVHWCE